MNHKAVAECPKGHTFEWGACKAKVKGFFGGEKECGSRLFEQIYEDGTALTVSFDDAPWVAARCVKCHTLFNSVECPECGASVPASAFKKKGLFAKLG